MDPRKALIQIVLVLIAVLAGIGFLFLRQRVPGVEARFATLPGHVGVVQDLALDLEAARGGVRTVTVRLVQGDQRPIVYEAAFDSATANRRRVDFTLRPAAVGAREGEGTLEVWAGDGFWRLKPVDDEPVLQVPVVVDLTAPGLEVVSFTRYPAQGGAGVAVLRSHDATSLEIRVGDLLCPATPQGPAAQGLAVAFFAVPFDHDPDEDPVAVARDEAGNETRRTVPTVIGPRRFERGRVELDADFLARKLPELVPERAPLAPEDYGEVFTYVSKDLRARAAATKRELSRRSADHSLWRGSFLQPRNTRVFSNYAETRDYWFDGKALDTRVHAGFDLASTRRAAVPAANHGIVVFASDLGIYGNTVVLDHGLGVQTLYSHLSALEVEEGQEVEQGREIGRTGTTGLAVGDHLHYEVLVHGEPTNPLQWWDAKWVQEHVVEVLAEAGLELGGAAGEAHAP
jgi:murein DD-endopeptidase MepM/ murein hydrolase activator NlpD